MTQEWGIYIALLVSLNIAGMVWLLLKTAKQTKKEKEQETTGHEWDGITELNTPLPRWWLWLFYLTIVFAVGYLVLYPGFGSVKGYLGWTQVAQYEKEAQAYTDQYAAYFDQFQEVDHDALAQNMKAMSSGRNLFLQHCAACHGSDGGGAVGYPNLRDHDWLYGSDEAAIKASITNGRQGMMPALGAVFSEQDRVAVIEYVRHLSQPSTVSEDVLAVGKEKFDMMCMACHGAGGTGNSLMGAPNLSDDIWLYGGDFDSIHETLMKGRNGKMPAHADILGPAKIHLLAAYVKSLSLSDQ